MPQFFRAQPYAWRRPPNPEEYQSSLMGDVVRAIGGIGSAYFQDKEQKRLEEIERQERELERKYRDRALDVEIADLRGRHRLITGDTPIARAVRDPLMIPGPAGQLSMIPNVLPERAETLREGMAAGGPIPEEVPGLGRIEIPSALYDRVKIGEDEYFGRRRADEYITNVQAANEAEALAERNRLIAGLTGRAMESTGGTPEQVEFAEAVAQYGEGGLPEGTVSRILMPPEVNGVNEAGEGISANNQFTAQRQALDDIFSRAEGRVEASRTRGSPDRVEGERRFATLDEVLANIERENGWRSGAIREAQRAILSATPWPTNLFEGALDRATTDGILESFGSLSGPELAEKMREYDFNDNEIQHVLNERLKRQ